MNQFIAIWVSEGHPKCLVCIPKKSRVGAWFECVASVENYLSGHLFDGDVKVSLGAEDKSGPIALAAKMAEMTGHQSVEITEYTWVNP